MIYSLGDISSLTGTGATPVSASGQDDWAHKLSNAFLSAGEAQAYSVTPTLNYVSASTQGQGDVTDDGRIPQGETSSLDQSGYDQAQWEYEKQLELLAEQRAYNSAEAEKNRKWQERMSNTAYQRAVEDLNNAGLNKWLAVTGGNGASASTPSGSSATSSAGDASAPNPVLYKEIIKLIANMSSSAVKTIGSLISAAI